ncbi:MAG: hypothetical protein R3A78_00535 [Polyangiales bacterium]
METRTVSSLALSWALVLPAAGCGADAGDTGSMRTDQALASSADGGMGAPRAEGRRGFRDGKGHHGRKGARFDRWDKDGDGKIALAELPERAQAHFGEADANKDGFVDREEIKAHFEAKRAEFMKQADTNGDGQLSDDERKAAFEKKAEARFAESDKNADGKLVEGEVPERMWQHLVVADADKDGALTFAELKAAHDNGTLRPRGGRGHGKKGFRGGHGGPGHGDGFGPPRGGKGGPRGATTPAE